jgi:hypothetical protein
MVSFSLRLLDRRGRGVCGFGEAWYFVKIDGPTNDVSLTICETSPFGFAWNLFRSVGEWRPVENLSSLFGNRFSVAGKYAPFPCLRRPEVNRRKHFDFSGLQSSYDYFFFRSSIHAF